MSPTPQVAAYYFPQYHADPSNDSRHGAGWTEWELLRRAEPRFPGHQQPKVPLWGYEDEADPEVAAKKIDAAADHGISAFIWDWYWYDGRPFLNRALEEGFLAAPNSGRLQFALMWANHDWVNLFPYKRGLPQHVFAEGTVPRESFDAAVEYIVANYLTHPTYWKIDGRPYFSVYELMNLVRGLGGMAATADALTSFRAKVRDAGLPDLHLNAVAWGIQVLPGEEKMENPNQILRQLGFDSVTSYVWIHHVELDSFPTVSYPEYARRATADWEKFARDFALPYYPNVTMGWDSSPRTVQSDGFEDLGYPFTPVLDGNAPGEFRKALEAGREFLQRGLTSSPILTINSWNEWTEGSYLEPDTTHGMGYLEAVREVFGTSSAATGR